MLHNAISSAYFIVRFAWEPNPQHHRLLVFVRPNRLFALKYVLNVLMILHSIARDLASHSPYWMHQLYLNPLSKFVCKTKCQLSNINGTILSFIRPNASKCMHHRPNFDNSKWWQSSIFGNITWNFLEFTFSPFLQHRRSNLQRLAAICFSIGFKS